MERWIQKRALDVGYYQMLHGEEPIADLGKIFLQRLIDKIKRREKTALSEHLGILVGFKCSVAGLDLLGNLKGKSSLFLSNHTENGPLRNGHWKIFATNYFVKHLTGKEIRWTYGQDRSTFQEFFRRPVTESINAISVREGNGTQGVREILKAFQNQDSVGVFPEGNGRKRLIRGNPKTGGIMLYAAEKNIPILAIAAWFKENTCHLSFNLLDNELIKSIPSKSSNKEEAKQKIVDYAMVEIAKNMPEELRGHYQDLQITIPEK